MTSDYCHASVLGITRDARPISTQVWGKRADVEKEAKAVLRRWYNKTRIGSLEEPLVRAFYSINNEDLVEINIAEFLQESTKES